MTTLRGPWPSRLAAPELSQRSAELLPETAHAGLFIPFLKTCHWRWLAVAVRPCAFATILLDTGSFYSVTLLWRFSTSQS